MNINILDLEYLRDLILKYLASTDINEEVNIWHELIHEAEDIYQTVMITDGFSDANDFVGWLLDKVINDLEELE